MAGPTSFGDRPTDAPGNDQAVGPILDSTHTSSGQRRFLILVAMIFGLLMPVLGYFMIDVALPSLQQSFDAEVSDLAWIIDAYTLVLASFLLVGGSLGDLYGRRRLFMWGVTIFTLASLACALSTSVEQLIACRAVQGLGAALLIPGSLSILTTTFLPAKRGSALGLWAAIWGLAISGGALIGGYLIENHSWEWIFLINVPAGVIAFLLSTAVKRSKDLSPSRRFDLWGSLLGSAAVLCLVYALIQGGPRGWRDDLIVGAFGLALILLIAFLIIQAKRRSPILPLRLFRNPNFAASNVVTAAVFFALFGVTFLLTQYLQNLQGFSTFETGLRLLPFAATVLVLSPIAGKISDHQGPRGLMTLGCAIAAGGMALLLLTEAFSAYDTVILPALITLGAGMSLTLASMTTAVMGSINPRHAGVGAGFTNMIRELGGVLGIVLLGAIVTDSFRQNLFANLVSGGLAGPDAQSIVETASSGRSGRGYLAVVQSQLPPEAGEAVIDDVITAAEQSFVEALHSGMLIAMGLVLLAAVVSLVFVRRQVGAQPALDAGRIRAGSGDRAEPDSKEVTTAPPSADSDSLNNVAKKPDEHSAGATADETPLNLPSVDRFEEQEMSSEGELDELNAILFDLPFKAGAGDMQQTIIDFLVATLPFQDYLIGETNRRWLPSDDSASVRASTSLDIATLSGYLMLEQRFDRINPRARPELAASLLVGAARALELWTLTDDEALARVYLVRGMVETLMTGIGKPNPEVANDQDILPPEPQEVGSTGAAG